MLPFGSDLGLLAGPTRCFSYCAGSLLHPDPKLDRPPLTLVRKLPPRAQVWACVAASNSGGSVMLRALRCKELHRSMQGYVTEPALEYKVADSPSEREAAFRLVYEAYLRSGLAEPNRYGLRVTPYHLLPTTTVFVAKSHGDVVCTVTLVEDGKLGLPLEVVYGREVAQLRRTGAKLAEVCSLADRRSDLSRALPAFVELTRLVAHFGLYHGTVRQLLVAVHPRHARFYQRFMAFEPFGPLRDYPCVRNRPAVALMLDLLRPEHRRHPNYRRFFGQPIDPKRLARSTMTFQERRLLRPVAALLEQTSPASPVWSAESGTACGAV